MKRFMCVVMVAMMVTLNSLTGFAASFTDIDDVPWNGAQTYINNAADAGLMSGENTSNGAVFRAKSNVTYCEAVQLAYNVMKKTSGVSASSSVVSKWIATMITYNIPNWAFEAVAYSLENNIIVISDVSKFMENNGDNNYATRQDVAVMFGKILAKTNALNYTTMLTFKDADTVSNVAVPYIELLVRLSIIKGDANNKFNPVSAINRAEMAVIAYNTYNTMKSIQDMPMQASGTVISNKEISTGRYTIMLNVNGQSKMFVADKAVQVQNGSKMVSPSTITANDSITITYKGYEISAAIITYDAVVEQQSKLDGIITYLRSNKIQIKTTDGNTYQYDMLKEVSVRLDDRSRDIDYLIDQYHSKDEISVALTLNNNDEVKKIVGTTKNTNKNTKKDNDSDYDGKIVSLSTTKLKLSSKSTYYSIKDEKDLDIDIEDGLNDNINDFDELETAFKANKTIQAKIYLDNNDYVTKITGEVTEVEGTLYSVKASSNTVKIKSNSKYYEYEYDDEDSVDVEINGRSKTIDNLASVEDNGLKVQLVLKDGYITDIYAGTSVNSSSNSSSDHEYEGRLTRVDSSTLRISSKSSSLAIDNEEDVNVEVEDGSNNRLTDIEELEDAIRSDKVIEATVYVEDDYVVEIKGEVIAAEGELTYVRSSGEIEIDVSSGNSTYECTNDVVISVDTADTLSELRTLMDSKRFTVKLTLKDGYVTRIDD